MLSAARSRKESAFNRLTGELFENLSGLEAAQRIEILTTTSLLPQAEATLQAALAGYENGKVDFATLLDAQRQIRNSQAGSAEGTGGRPDAPRRHRTAVGRGSMKSGTASPPAWSSGPRRGGRLLVGQSGPAAGERRGRARPRRRPGGRRRNARSCYYRNPMGLPDTSPVPKKDPMGMDYIAVYEGEEPTRAATRSRSAPTRCRSSAFEASRRRCARWTRS